MEEKKEIQEVNPGQEAQKSDQIEEVTKELLKRRIDELNLNTLLEAGVHFGHQKSRWNPKMKEYIFAERNGIHIIDLQKTLVKLKEAYEAVKEIAANGGTILFVGTKRQAQEIIKKQAQRAQQPYVVKKWLGGTLTNFESIKRSIDKYLKLKAIASNENELNKLPKKERNKLLRKLKKLEERLEGLSSLRSIPDAIYVVDVKREMIAVLEAKKVTTKDGRKGIPVIAMVDTNGDPTLVDYPIPANDDAIKSIQIITELIADAVIEGINISVKRQAEKGFIEGMEESNTKYTEELAEEEEKIIEEAQQYEEMQKIKDDFNRKYI